MEKTFLPFWRVFWPVLGLGLFFGALSPVYAAEIIPNDPLFAKQWALRQIQAPLAWSMTTGSQNVVVAVLDAGTDLTHPDLASNAWTNTREIPGDGIDNDQNGYVDDVHGWNFVKQSSKTSPTSIADQSDGAWSHGTLVASLIGAKGNDGIGMAGVAWNVRLMPLVVLDVNGFGSTQSIVEAIQYAVDNGADIINLSLVGYEQDPSLDEVIKRAYDAGVLVVSAVGNDTIFPSGVDLDLTPAYPVCVDGGRNQVLGVGGTDPLDQRSPYANYGTFCMDIVAPSMQLLGAHPSLAQVGVTSTPDLYVNGLSGTSLAAPLVSGAAALVKSLRPSWGPEQIIRQLIETADPIEFQNLATAPGRLSTRRLNVGRAIQALQPTAQPITQIKTGIIQGTTSTTLTWELGKDKRTLKVDGTRLLAFWREGARAGWEGFVFYRDANQRIRVRVWQPAANSESDDLIALDGRQAWLLLPVSDHGQVVSIFFSSLRSPNVGIWNLDRRDFVVKQPYGSKYRAGIQAFASPDKTRVLFWPTSGGGQALFFDAQGVLRGQAFPFGKNVIGAWTLKQKTAQSLQVRGPKNLQSEMVWEKLMLNVSSSAPKS